jgi:hypothetical protein
MKKVQRQLELLMGSRRTAPAASASSTVRGFLDQNRLVGVFIFALTVAAIVIISSAGISTINLPVLPGQIATIRVIATASFPYVSEEKTNATRAQVVNRVPPVYHLDFQPLLDFQAAARDLLAKLEVFEAGHRSGPPASGQDPGLIGLADEFNLGRPYRVSADDLAALLTVGDASTRSAIFENGLAALREIYSEGVHDDSFVGTDVNGGFPGRPPRGRHRPAADPIDGGRIDFSAREPRGRRRAPARRRGALPLFPRRGDHQSGFRRRRHTGPGGRGPAVGQARDGERRARPGDHRGGRTRHSRAV